ncbi:MAG TPA: hypothetical protein VFV95_03335 [Vicinamibacterales bacterium]|nr:hypothetical protein [Vicinamibacterales bacterium]
MAGNTVAPDGDSPLESQQETHHPLLASTLVLVALAAIFGFALALFRIDDRLSSHSIGKDESDIRGAVGTLGETDSSAKTLPDAELVLLNGDGAQPRPGARARVTARASQLPNAATFWAGMSPRDMLVVINRDLRTQEDRDGSRPAERALPVNAEGIVRLDGVVERVPSAEGMFSWGLTDSDRRRLASRGVYLRVEQISSETPLPAEGTPTGR